jgi:hypothetical protein
MALSALDIVLEVVEPELHPLKITIMVREIIDKNKNRIDFFIFLYILLIVLSELVYPRLKILS